MGAILTRNKEGVLSVFELQGKPCFSIWENTKHPAFSCSDETEDEREAMLIKYLNIIAESGTTAQFMIKFHDAPAKGKINNTTPVSGSLPFRFSEPNDLVKTSGNAGSAGIDMLREVFSTKMEMLDMKYQRIIEDKDAEIEALQQQLDAEPEPGDSDDMGMIGKIMDRVERNPSLNNLFNKLLDTAGDFLTVSKHKMRAQGANVGGGISGVEEDQTLSPTERLNGHLKVLIEYFVKQHGQGNTAEEKYNSGFLQMVDALGMLAKLTNDPDMMELALKKLRALE